MFYPIFCTIIAAILFVGSLRDPGDTLRRVTLGVMLFAPAWMTCQLKSLSLDHRTAAYLGSVMLIAILFGHIPLRKWLWTDTFCLAVWIGQVVSQGLIDQLRPLTAPEMARSWILPYLLGRTFFLNWKGEVHKLVPYVGVLLFMTACFDAFEGIVKINIVNKCFGKVFSVLESGEGYRWGMKRSQGPMVHPIYNGMMLTLMLPWALSVAKRGFEEKKKRWMIAPLLLAAALFFTVSRGPQLAFIMASGVAFFFRYPKLRILTLTVAIVGGGGIMVLKDPLMKALKSAAGETEENARILVIDGQEVEYSGTNHRMLLFLVYGQALRETGYFGYGAGMKDIPIAEGAGERFGSIDNHYVKHLLEYGWWGLISFAGLGLGGVYYASRLAWNANAENSTFAAGLAGGILATSLMMMTVWFSFDYGSVWLMSVGMAANLYSLRPKPERRVRMPRRAVRQPVVRRHRPAFYASETNA